MIVRRLAALKPWMTPLALSVAVHGAIVGVALGLNGLVEPPRPEVVMPVELVFAVAPAAGTRATSDHTESLLHSSSFPRKRESSGPGPAFSRGRRQGCSESSGPCSKPAEPPAHDIATASKRPTTTPVALPPLPKRKPVPPHPILASAPAQPAKLSEAESRAADRAIAAMLDDAAAKAAIHVTTGAVSPPILSLPHKGGGNPGGAIGSPSPLMGAGRGGGDETRFQPVTRQASRTAPAAALVPPAWGRPGLANAPPAYPLAARRSGAEGRVVLRVRVSADGAVETVRVAVSSGHELLDEAARRGVAGWRFVPGRLAGVPVAASVDVPVVFRLRD